MSKRYVVEDINDKKSHFVGKNIFLNGTINLKSSGINICSNTGDECIPIEASIEIYESLKRLDQESVNLQGRYMEHTFSDDGMSFSPSRFVISKIL